MQIRRTPWVLDISLWKRRPQLYKVWDNVAEADRLKIIKGLTHLGHQLAAIQFPTYGSLYFRHSIFKTSERILLDSSVDPTGLFCVYPFCGPAWTALHLRLIYSPISAQVLLSNFAISHQLRCGSKWWQGLIFSTLGWGWYADPLLRLVSMHLQTGLPYSTALYKITFLYSIPRRCCCRIWRTTLFCRKNQGQSCGTLTYIWAIYLCRRMIIPIFLVLSIGNIRLSPSVPTSSVACFLIPRGGYCKSEEILKLPANFEELDADEKEIALFEKDRAICAKAYKVATYLNNNHAYTAGWDIFQPWRELFLRIGDSWVYGIIPLCTCLVRIFESWEQISFLDSCPIQFTFTEIASHEEQLYEYAQWYEIQDFSKNHLGIDDEDWLPPGTEWARKKVAKQGAPGPHGRAPGISEVRLTRWGKCGHSIRNNHFTQFKDCSNWKAMLRASVFHLEGYFTYCSIQEHQRSGPQKDASLKVTLNSP